MEDTNRRNDTWNTKHTKTGVHDNLPYRGWPNLEAGLVGIGSSYSPQGRLGSGMDSGLAMVRVA